MDPGMMPVWVRRLRFESKSLITLSTPPRPLTWSVWVRYMDCSELQMLALDRFRPALDQAEPATSILNALEALCQATS